MLAFESTKAIESIKEDTIMTGPADLAVPATGVVGGERIESKEDALLTAAPGTSAMLLEVSNGKNESSSPSE